MLARVVFHLIGAAVVICLLRVVGRHPSLRSLIWCGVALWALLTAAASLLGGRFFGITGLVAQGAFLWGGVYLYLAGALLFRRAKLVACLAWFFAVAVTAVGVDAWFIEPRLLEVTTYRLEFVTLARPMRIAVLSDLQTDHVGRFERRVLEELLRQEPDAIFLTGDYLQIADKTRWEEERARLNALLRELDFQAPKGIFAVGGNTDPPAWPTIFRDLQVLPFPRSRDERTAAFMVTALDLFDSFDPGLSVPHAGGFHVAFGHAPDFALGDVRANLLIAGHTHGGQVQLPLLGPLLTFSQVPRSWAEGVTELEGGRYLVVSRGVGMERGGAPRVRFLCRPQLVILDLRPATSPASGPPSTASSTPASR